MNFENLFLNTCFAFLSAVFGTAIGVLHNDRRVRRAEKNSRERLRQELVAAFQFNIERLRQIQRQLADNVVPDFRLDTESVAHILFHGRDLFDGGEWFVRFNWQRFQLCHLNAQIDFLNVAVNLAAALGPKAATAVAAQRYASLAGHSEISALEITELIEEYTRVTKPHKLYPVVHS